MSDLTQQQWAAQLKTDPTASVVDVRTPQEYQEGFIPHARNIDIYMGSRFIDELKKLDPSVHYYVYCKAGSRSAQACALMKQMGLTAYNLLGGYKEWRGETTLPS